MQIFFTGDKVVKSEFNAIFQISIIEQGAVLNSITCTGENWDEE